MELAGPILVRKLWFFALRSMNNNNIISECMGLAFILQAITTPIRSVHLRDKQAIFIHKDNFFGH
jgi:hypothetical protein